MMDKFKQFILGVSPQLSLTSLELLRKITVLKEYKVKDNLYEFGKIPTKFYILISGITKSYTILDNGNEYVNRLHNKGEVMGPLTALIENSEANFGIECITDCDILECTYQDFIHLSESDLNFGIFHRKYLELLYVSYTQRIKEFLSLSGVERYLKLRKRIPGIDTLVSQKLIASHLAITPIQLSRIRNKLKSKV
ncbi:MAG: Crp/Fnr family transcriptional regulator [Urechidicola sp.]